MELILVLWRGKKTHIKWKYFSFASQNLFFLGVLFSKLHFINLSVIWGKYNLRTNRINLFFYESRQKIKMKGKKRGVFQSLEYAIRVYVYQNTVWNRNLSIQKIRQWWRANFSCLIYLTAKWKLHWFSLTTVLCCQI